MNVTFRLAVLAGWLLSGPAGSAFGQPAASPTNAPGGERFLIIVETSAAMQKRADNVRMVVGSIIANGLKGQMSAGSTLGLWMFNQELITGQLPLQLWSPATRQRVAQNAVAVIEQQKFEHTAQLAVVWAAATNLIAHSEHLTLLLVTSGGENFTGTPYDALIAESFRANAEQQRKSNMPFLTILRAAKGQLVAFAVNTPPWPLEVPEYPDEFKPKPAPGAAKPATNQPPPVPPRLDRSILAATNIIYLAGTSAPVDGPVARPDADILPTNAAALAPPQPEQPSSTNQPVGAKPATQVSGTNAVIIAEKPPAAGAEPKKFPLVATVAGGAALLVLLAIAWGTRRRRTGESLITRSLQNKDR